LFSIVLFRAKKYKTLTHLSITVIEQKIASRFQIAVRLPTFNKFVLAWEFVYTRLATFECAEKTILKL